MKQWVHLFFFGLLIAGCNNKGKDNDILPSARMQAVLSDLMRADQFISDFRVPKDTAMDRDVESIKLYQQVFTIHNISRTRFEKSLAYYQSRPDLLKIIMDSISKPPVVVPVQTTPSKDSLYKKDSTFLPKDSTNPARDSALRRKKKILLRNK